MNPTRLFAASCVALITTSMVFSIRGDILDALAADFRLTKEQIGLCLSPAFWGFTLSIWIGGSLVDFLGMRRLLLVSAGGYVAAVLAILLAPRPAAAPPIFYTDPGFITLYAAMLTLGLSQGLVEGVINPLAASMYPREKTHKLNVLHAWWPGGLIIGGLASYALTKLLGLDAASVPAAMATFGWQVKLGLVIVPAIVYATMIWNQPFPKTERVAAGVSNRDMVREVFAPLFVLWWVCMWMTAATELGPDQWVGSVMTQVANMQGILLLVYTASLMFILRFFGGRLAHALSPLGLLTLSSVLSAAGLWGLSSVSTPGGAFLWATIFGIGKTFFWPLMLAFTAERFAKSGALGLAIIGGTGNLSVAFILPVMGSWYDTQGPAAAFRHVAYLPAVLTVIFGVLLVTFRRKSTSTEGTMLKAAAD
ncbi:MAG: MFS transporter [Bryobacterales bacterium]|nr:MFS transporter [Bryobacterales bacterium]